MNEKLNRVEYQAIAKEVFLQLQTLFPQVDAQVIQCVFGPEMLAKPLRISTLKTKIDFIEAEKKAVFNLREKIKREQDQAIRERKLQQLESIILFGQIVFSQSACIYFLKECKSIATSPKIAKLLSDMSSLIEEEGIAIESSRFDVLSRRKRFAELFSEMQQQIKIQAEINANELGDIYKLKDSLAKTKVFYNQINDLNFRYAQKPSRSFSKFVNALQNYGSKVSLTAAIIGIGATALSFIPPLTPIMAPIAITSSYVALFVGLPLALKNIGTILYNMFRFGAAPTPGELIGASFLGMSLLTAGLGGLASQLVTLGITSEWAMLTVNGIKAANQLTKTSFGIAGQFSQSAQKSEVELVNEYRVSLDLT